MPVVRNAQLRIPSYVPLAKGSGGDTGNDLIFALKVSRIQKDISDGATALIFPGFENALLGYSMIRFTISITGAVLEDGQHDAHPLVSAAFHIPDFVDMEEAAICWNNQAAPGVALSLLPSLMIEHDGGDWREYKGVISRMELTRREGYEQVDFNMTFLVAWSESNPGLREWN
jgi:hypothetical protein